MDDFKNAIKLILTNPAVWASFLLLMHELLTYFVPNFPANILAAIEGLIIAVLAAIGIAGVVIKIRVEKEVMRRMKSK